MEPEVQPVVSYSRGSEEVDNSSDASHPVMELSSGRKAVQGSAEGNSCRGYKQGIWTLQELLILQAVRREDLVRRKEGFEQQLKQGLAQKELKSRVERWQQIEEACWTRGVHRSAEQCQSRWEYMSREWRRINHHETSCTRSGEPSYWTMTPADRTQKGLVSNFYYELYQALLEWVEKLTRNVHFHQCPGISYASHPAGCTDSSTGDLPGASTECHASDANVGICSSSVTSTAEHSGSSHPIFQSQYPPFPQYAPCSPGVMFPYPAAPWVHPPAYPLHPSYFQSSVPHCALVSFQAPRSSPTPCSPLFFPTDCTPYCIHSGGCRAPSNDAASTLLSCPCGCCGAGQIPVTGGQPAQVADCQVSNSARSIPSASSPLKSGHSAQPQPNTPPTASESARATNFPQGSGDVMQSCLTTCKAAPKSETTAFLAPCSSCPPAPHLPAPFFYGAPVYLPYPCPRCNLSPWGFNCTPNPYGSFSGSPMPSFTPPQWNTAPEKDQENSTPSAQGSHLKVPSTNLAGAVSSESGLASGSDRVHLDTGMTHFQDFNFRATDGEANEAGEQLEEEPRFVMTEEWTQFFAKSEARRREKKRQQKREAKAARKAAKPVISSHQENN